MLIDRDKALEAIDEVRDLISVTAYCAITERLKKLSSAVIRCKDCKYHVGEGCCDYWDEGRMFLDISDSDYCSKAERRTE